MSDKKALPLARGYRPGIIGRIAEMHAVYYSRRAGFGQFFEARVASGVAEFTSRLSSSRNASSNDNASDAGDEASTKGASCSIAQLWRSPRRRSSSAYRAHLIYWIL